VYRLVHESGKCYIGQSKSLLERMRQHNRRPPLKMRSILKGESNLFHVFDLEVLYMTHVKAQANRVETYFVDLYQSRKPGMGYNTLKGCPYADPKYWAMKKYRSSLKKM
jgi:predicted GIY-YIG superfamily endonuclease